MSSLTTTPGGGFEELLAVLCLKWFLKYPFEEDDSEFFFNPTTSFVKALIAF